MLLSLVALDSINELIFSTMERKMKLLAVLRFNPFPPRAGSAIVAYNSIKNLSEDKRKDFIQEFKFKALEFEFKDQNKIDLLLKKLN